MATLYEDDILAWSEAQAALLRRLAAGERVNDALDWDNLIDEVESVGRSQLQSVESLLDIGLTHLVAAAASPRPEPVQHWLAEARAALARAARRVTPGMRPRLDLADLWAEARTTGLDKAVIQGGAARAIPIACPFTLDELLNREPDMAALLARI